MSGSAIMRVRGGEGVSESITAIAVVPAEVGLRAIRDMVLQSAVSAATRVMYGRALDTLFRWREANGAPPLTWAMVHAYRGYLQEQGYSAAEAPGGDPQASA